jgi:hypothetical protein
LSTLQANQLFANQLFDVTWSSALYNPSLFLETPRSLMERKSQSRRAGAPGNYLLTDRRKSGRGHEKSARMITMKLVLDLLLLSGRSGKIRTGLTGPVVWTCADGGLGKDSEKIHEPPLFFLRVYCKSFSRRWVGLCSISPQSCTFPRQFNGNSFTSVGDYNSSCQLSPSAAARSRG